MKSIACNGASLKARRGFSLTAIFACWTSSSVHNRSDRLRMTVNIYSDSVGSAIVQQFSRLKPIEDSLDESLVPEQRPLVARLGKRASQFLPGSAVEGALHGADREEQLSSILRPLARRRGTLAYVPQPAATPGGWRSPLKRASLRPSSSPRPAPSPSSTSSNATRDVKEKQGQG